MRKEYDITLQIENMGLISDSVTVIHSYVIAITWQTRLEFDVAIFALR